MGKLIAFDEESTAAAATQTQMAVLFQRGDALDAALSSASHPLVVVPGAAPGEVLLLNIRHNSSANVLPSPIAYEASGFLGLSDEPVYEQAQPPRRWWQKILE